MKTKKCTDKQEESDKVNGEWKEKKSTEGNVAEPTGV